jgi:hypothetical protein
MRVNRSQYDDAMQALFNFSAKYPNFDSRATIEVDSEFNATTQNGLLVQAVGVLNEAAGMWSCGEKSFYTNTKFYHALNLINKEIGDFKRPHTQDVKIVKVQAQKTPNPDSKRSIKKAARQAGYQGKMADYQVATK